MPKKSPEVFNYRHAAWKALSKFHKDGLIRSIGVSNFLVKHLKDLKTQSQLIPALNQVEWHPKCYDLDLLEYCKKNNIVLQAYSSLGSSKDTSLRKDSTVIRIAKKIGKSPSQVLLRWAVQRDIPIIPKASSRNHLVENINLNFEIPVDEMTVLDGMKQCQRYDDSDPDGVI